MSIGQQVTDLRKRGQVDEAYRLAQDLLRDHPGDYSLKGAFGWVLYAQAKRLVDAARDPHAAGGGADPKLRLILREYARLGLQRPDLLFSMLLVQLLNCPTPASFLPGLMAWAGLGCFRPEDLCAQEGRDGRVYEPLIEKAARVTGKVALELEESGLKEHAILLLDKALSEGEIQKPEWLHYRKALLLGRLGRYKEAQELIFPFVRGKRGDFWAWQALAELEEPTDPKLALTLYAKAVTVSREPEFALKLFEEFSQMASRQGEIGLAKWAADHAVSVRRENSWRIPQSLKDLLSADWYSSGEDLENPQGMLERLAAGADSLLYSDCPRREATYLGNFASKNGRPMVRFAVRQGETSVELVSPAKGLMDPQAYKVGQPISVSVLEGVERSSIVEVRQRLDGGPFDCVPRKQGVVDHQNGVKELTSIYLTPDEYCLLHYRDFPDAQRWTPGTTVEVNVVAGKYGLRACLAELSRLKANEWVMRVEGEISIHEKGFGFVNRQVFVPPPLAGKYRDGQVVSLVAVKKRKRNSNEIGWTAVGSPGADVVDMAAFRAAS